MRFHQQIECHAAENIEDKDNELEDKLETKLV